MCIFDKLPDGAVKFGLTIRIMGRKILEAQYNPISNVYWTILELRNSQHIHLNVRKFKTWHRRFGHAGKDVMRQLPKHTKGVDAVDSADEEPCDGCAFGKSTRHPFPPSDKHATEPLELVHTDLDGPMHTQAIGGWSYFAGFIDDYSGLTRAYYLKHKSDAIQAFHDFKAWAETQTGKKIKKIRSDRGGEYTSNEFTELLRSYGIEHQKTLPGSPQQNGRAECWNRTIVEKAMAMLHQAGLSHGFWQLALDTAVHIYNCQPMRRLKWRCPITLWDGTVPDVSYFRVFGYKAFVHVQKAKHEGKLDKKAVEMIFVGYESGSKGYRFWNPANHSVVVSRDVTFDKESFPAFNLPGNRPVTPSDNLFPDDQSDETSNADSDFPDPIEIIPHIPVPLVDNRPPTPDPPAEPDPPEPAPAPVPAPAQPPENPPVPPPHPSHHRGRNQPVGGPSVAHDHPKRTTAGIPAKSRTENDAYGNEDPASIDARTDPDGNQREAETILAFLAAAQYKAGLPQSHKEAMRSPEADKWRAAEKSEYDSLMENKT